MFFIFSRGFLLLWLAGTVVAPKLDSHHIDWILRKHVTIVSSCPTVWFFLSWLLFFFLKGLRKEQKKKPNKKNQKKKSPARFYFYVYFLFSVNHFFLSKKNELKKKKLKKNEQNKNQKKNANKEKSPLEIKAWSVTARVTTKGRMCTADDQERRVLRVLITAVISVYH